MLLALKKQTLVLCFPYPLTVSSGSNIPQQKESASLLRHFRARSFTVFYWHLMFSFCLLVLAFSNFLLLLYAFLHLEMVNHNKKKGKLHPNQWAVVFLAWLVSNRFDWFLFGFIVNQFSGCSGPGPGSVHRFIVRTRRSSPILTTMLKFILFFYSFLFPFQSKA